MPSGEPGGVERRQVVVWRFGDAILSIPLHDAVEIAAVAADGTARCREGSVPVLTPPGLGPHDRARRAVVIRAGERLVAIAAEVVEGVRSYRAVDETAAPDWLDRVRMPYVAGLVRLDDRVVALLAADRLADL